ncbi:MAG: lysophospholipid acyltransferase family protein [Anaerolineae bacterium]|nr:lysophospholipid acyltransferase family protein [Anaerolineae bacterium]
MSEYNSRPPQVGIFRKLIGKVIMLLGGWKTENNIPQNPKMVLIFAPHTSNWDFIFMLGGAYAMGLKPNWMGKKELFWGPAYWMFKALGGIPVDRKNSKNTVDATVEAIKKQEKVLLGIAPEGTRKKASHWKSGFYHIAHKAGIPITFAFLDYHNKIVGVKPGITTTGNIEEDLAVIQDFYKDIEGKFPGNIGLISFKSMNPQV